MAWVNMSRAGTVVTKSGLPAMSQGGFTLRNLAKLGVAWCLLCVYAAGALAAPGVAVKVDASATYFEVPAGDVAVAASPAFGAGPHAAKTVEIPGFRKLAEPGLPAIPGVSYFVALPPGVRGELVVEASEARDLGEAWLEPVPPLAGDDSAVVHDPSVYGQDTWFPAEPVAITMRGVARDIDFVKVEVRPVQWNPVSGALRVSQNLRFHIRYGVGGESGGAMAPRESTRERGGGRGRASQPAAPAEVKFNDSMFVNQPVPSSWHVRRTGAGSFGPANPAAVGESYKIEIENDGLYQVGYTSFQAVGLGTPRFSDLRLELRGQLVPFQALDSNGNDTFDAGDAIEFHGVANPEHWTRKHIYWLSLSGSGLTMTPRAAFPPGTETLPAVNSSKRAVRVEANEARLGSSRHDPRDWEPWVYTQPLETGGGTTCLGNTWPQRTLSAVATGVAKPVPGRAYELRGVLSSFPVTLCIPPTRSIDLSLNGAALGNVSWNQNTDPGGMLNAFTLPVDPATILEGGNAIRLDQPSVSGKLVRTFIDYVELDYEAHLLASAGAAYFTGTWPAGAVLWVGGFTSANVEIVDVRSDGVVERILGGRALSLGPGMPVSLSFAIPPSTLSHRIAMVERGRLPSAPVSRDTPSDLRNLANRGHFVAIAHADFVAASSQIADYHFQREAMSVQTLDIQDVYDEFTWGLIDPIAVHDLLEYALLNWEDPPLYALLVGDSTDDPKAYRARNIPLGIPHPEYVRRGLGQPYDMQLSADGLSQLLIGADSVPDLLLGRLAVQSPSEVLIYLDKMRQHEAAPVEPWSARSLVFIDDDIEGNDQNCEPGINQWEQAVIDLSCCYLNGKAPGDFNLMMLDNYGWPAGRDEIIAEHDRGVGLALYYGHGSITGLGKKCPATFQDFFDDLDITRLDNASTLPIFTSVSCNVGRFDWIEATTGKSRCMGETFTVTSPKGHLAFISQSTETTTGEGLGQITGVLDGLYRPGSTYLPPWGPAALRDRVGGVHFAAQMGYLYNVTVPDVRKDDNAITLNLLGDPAILHKVPFAPSPDKAACERSTFPAFLCPP